jgi:hypothetical protein
VSYEEEDTYREVPSPRGRDGVVIVVFIREHGSQNASFCVLEGGEWGMVGERERGGWGGLRGGVGGGGGAGRGGGGLECVRGSRESV